MAIFRVPKITTHDRTQLVLSVSEIVYDTDTASFFGGDGVTSGGVEIGRDSGLKIMSEKITLTQQHINDKSITLVKEPTSPDSVMFRPEGGLAQVNGIDFDVYLNVISWDGLGLDNFLEVNEVINITYYYY